ARATPVAGTRSTSTWLTSSGPTVSAATGTTITSPSVASIWIRTRTPYHMYIARSVPAEGATTTSRRPPEPPPPGGPPGCSDPGVTCGSPTLSTVPVVVTPA